MSEIPYMMANTREEFERVRNLAWPAPAPSHAEQAVIDRFEAAEEPEEIRVERVARAIWESQSGTRPWPDISDMTRAAYRLRAPLVLAALDPS